MRLRISMVSARYPLWVVACGVVFVATDLAHADPVFNGHVENATEDYGYYALLTGGIAENGQTRDGTRGTM